MSDPQVGPLENRAIPRVGLGCMGMSEFYGVPDDGESLRVLHEAVEIGYRHLDTADMYGQGRNEELVGTFLRSIGSKRHELLLATKGGIRRDSGSMTIDSSREYLLRACDQSLRRLGVERIDLYYLHRRNPAVPIEETMDAMAELVTRGKIGAVGLSEVSAATLRAAARIMPIGAVQSEYSLWTRDPEQEVLPACRELGVPFVAYSPLGRGFLSGELELDRLKATGDLRTMLPRFQDQAFDANKRLLGAVSSVADELGVSRSQIALAWVLAQDRRIHAIPGTRRLAHARDNFASQSLTLSERHLSMLTSAFGADSVVGARYPEPLLRTTNA